MTPRGLNQDQDIRLTSEDTEMIRGVLVACSQLLRWAERYGDPPFHAALDDAVRWAKGGRTLGQLPACSGFRQPTWPGTAGNRSSRATRTTCRLASGCCTSSPTASNGRPPSNWPAGELLRPIFCQLGGRPDGRPT